MSVLLLAGIALPGGLATALLARRSRWAFAVGLVAALACVVLAGRIRAEDTIPLAGSIIGGSDALRTIAVAWAVSTLAFGCLDALLGDGPEILGPALVGLGLGALGLSVSDAGIAFASLTTGAIVASVLPIGAVRGGAAAAPGLGIRSVRPVLAAGLLGLGAVIWSASPAGPFVVGTPLGGVDPALETALGLALLAAAAAVAIRLGAIPVHVWAARFTEAMPASAVPPLFGWGAAAFTIVALGWVDATISSAGVGLDVERAIVALVAVASIVLGGIAAVLHDDLEHVLAYAIVQDAGVALLAFAAPLGTASDDGRTWVVAAVAVTSGLAAWVLATRSTFGHHRRFDLGGWARRSPILGVAFAAVLVAAVGLPGMAAFDARSALVGAAIPGPLGLVVLLFAFAPVVYLGRVLATGLDRMTEPVRAARHVAPVLELVPSPDWGSGRSALRDVPATVRANRLPLAAATAVVVAAVGLWIAIGGLGSSTGGTGGGPGLGPSAPPSGSPTLETSPTPGGSEASPGASVSASAD